MATITPNPETVEVLLETSWRLAEAEGARTESLDRKATSLATFAALVVSLTATAGANLVGAIDGSLGVALHAIALALVVSSAFVGARVLLPEEHAALGAAYIQRFTSWAELVKPPEQVHGETLRGVVRSIARERAVNTRKARYVRTSLFLLLAGLLIVAGEALILGISEVR